MQGHAMTQRAVHAFEKATEPLELLPQQNHSLYKTLYSGLVAVGCESKNAPACAAGQVFLAGRPVR